MRRAFQSVLKNSSGNVAIITALTLVAVIGMGGAAYDLAAYSDDQARYTAAADAAALAAVSFAQEKEAQGELSEREIKTQAASYGMTAWKANLGSDEMVDKVPANMVVSRGDEGWTSRLRYTAQFPTAFLGVLGVNRMSFTGASAATSALDEAKWEFNFMIDTSSSMGLGATDADMTAMRNNPKIGCEFACHRDVSPPYANTIDLAHAAGVTLRVDVVDAAVNSVVGELEEKESHEHFKASLYGMADDLTELVPLNANLSRVKNYGITLAEATASRGNTNYRVAMEKITSKITGNDSNAHKVLFIVTDGVHDAPRWESNVETIFNGNHQLGPMDPRWCSALKASGVQVAVLHVNYKVPSRAPFPSFVEGYEDEIVPNLRSCASSGLFISADEPSGITDGLKTLLSKTLEAHVRLTE